MNHSLSVVQIKRAAQPQFLRRTRKPFVDIIYRGARFFLAVT